MALRSLPLKNSITPPFCTENRFLTIHPFFSMVDQTKEGTGAHQLAMVLAPVPGEFLIAAARALLREP
jgi:hypothetical protein